MTPTNRKILIVVIVILLLPVMVLLANWAMIHYGSDSMIRLNARLAARLDVAINRPKICLAGNPPYYIGLSREREDLWRLPDFTKGAGCINPLGERSVVYAEAYNQQLARSLPDQDRRDSKKQFPWESRRQYRVRMAGLNQQ